MITKQANQYIATAKKAASKGKLELTARLLDAAATRCWSDSDSEYYKRQARDIRWAAVTGCILFCQIG